MSCTGVEVDIGRVYCKQSRTHGGYELAISDFAQLFPGEEWSVILLLLVVASSHWLTGVRLEAIL